VTVFATIIDTDALLKVVLWSLLTGVGLTVVFSLGIVGVARADDLRRTGKGGAATGYAILAVIAGLVVLGAVVEAIIVMTTK
jgi:hypothetical protein